MSKEKIAFVATVFRHLEAFHLPFMQFLHKQGYEVHAYAANDEGKKGVMDIGVFCHDLSLQRSPFALKNWRGFKEMLQSFKTENFALVHLHTPVASIYGRLAALWSPDTTVLYTAHGFHFHSGGSLTGWLLYYPAERCMARYTDYLITINQEDYQRAQAFPVRRKVAYLPGIGLDVAYYSQQHTRTATRAQLGLAPHNFAVLCVAELNQNKNQIQLLEAMAQAVQQYPQMRCFLVGEGEAKERLQAEVAARGLDRQVAFLGYRRDIPELLAASDAVALLSKREGLSKAVMEAMAAGKPVIATAIRGNRDLIADQENGLLVQVGDVPATVRALVQLAAKPDLALKMGQKNLEKVQAFDIQIVLQQMAKMYQEALDSK